MNDKTSPRKTASFEWKEGVLYVVNGEEVWRSDDAVIVEVGGLAMPVGKTFRKVSP